MDFILVLGIPILIVVGLTILFITKGIPSWVENVEFNSSTIWNLGIITITSMSIVIYLYKN
tara:strand:+ start:308 stop:490 length:183 start_codon:yes stop_codon:yes gene_type:complete